MSNDSITPLSQLHERQLAELLRSGNSAAFEEIVRRYEYRLQEIAVTMLSSSAAAAQAVQHTLHTARNTIHEYNGESLLFTWLSKKLLKYILNHHLKPVAVPVADDHPAQLPEQMPDN